MKRFVLIILTFLFASAIQAQPKKEAVSYSDGDFELEGLFVYDKLLKSKRGGVLLVHDVNGRDEFINKKAEELADIGYVVFVADMYGKGILPKDDAEAEDLSEPFLGEDRQLMRSRAKAGLDILANHKKVDVRRLAAIGYGFGGQTVLELARSGENLTAVISFYGNLSTPAPQDANNIKGSILVLNGSDDPKISKEEVIAFQNEMRDANVDWHMTIYGGAVHGFTTYSLGFDTASGKAYNYNADKRSWEAVKSLFREKLK
jgi:dienelactone hydrolase